MSVKPVMLRCGHSAVYSPRPIMGDLVWCKSCDDYFKCVTGAAMWWYKCIDCHRKFGEFGQQRLGNVDKRAGRHAQSLAHKVAVYNGDNLHHYIDARQDALDPELEAKIIAERERDARKKRERYNARKQNQTDTLAIIREIVDKERAALAPPDGYVSPATHEPTEESCWEGIPEAFPF